MSAEVVDFKAKKFRVDPETMKLIESIATLTEWLAEIAPAVPPEVGSRCAWQFGPPLLSEWSHLARQSGSSRQINCITSYPPEWRVMRCTCKGRVLTTHLCRRCITAALVKIHVCATP